MRGHYIPRQQLFKYLQGDFSGAVPQRCVIARAAARHACRHLTRWTCRSVVGADGRALAAWYPAVGGRVRRNGVDVRAVLKSAPLGLGVIDPRGRFLLVNDALARSMGRPASEVLGADVLGFLHPDERESARASLDQMFAGTLPGTRWERRYLRP